MTRRCDRVGSLLLGAVPALVLGLALPLQANWERVAVHDCTIPDHDHGSPHVVSDIRGAMRTGLDAFCPVPDTNDIPVASIVEYELWGQTNFTSNSPGIVRVRSCNQFTNGQGTECAAAQNLPNGAFAGFNVTVPTFWSQWWHSQFVHIDTPDNGNIFLSRILVTN
jgi:hypothetical protein